MKNDRYFESIRGKTEIITLNSWGYRRLRSKKYSLKLCTSRKDYYFVINNVLQPIWQEHDAIKSVLENTRTRGWIAKNLIKLFDYLKTLGFRHDKYKGFDNLSNQIRWLFEVGMGNHVFSLIRQFEDLEIVQRSKDIDMFIEQFESIDNNFMPFWCEACEHLYQSSIITLEDQKYWALIDLEQKIEQKQFTTGMHRFSHILVDEFQDINVLDLNLLKAIAEINKAELTIVGDDDQSIFEWRGASPSFILKPDEHIKPGYKTHVLEVNYRSPKNIVEYSQKLIQHNKKRVSKKVIAKSNKDADIYVKSMPSLSGSVDFVLKTVKDLLNKDNIKNIAIIGRKRSQIIPYQIIFASEDIPFYAAEDLQIFLSEAFQELKEILSIKARSELSGIMGADPIRDILKLCDKVKKYPLSKKDSGELKRYLYKNNPKSLRDAIGALMVYEGPLKGKNQSGIMSMKFAEAIMALLESKTVAGSIDAISDNFEGLQKDYGKSLEDIFYADPPFLYLSDYAERYGDNYQAFYTDIEKAISTLARVPSDEENDQEDESWKVPLHLMTALRSKGKEFDIVFILDANQGVWPSKLAENEDQLEQERRLFYVAFTRARKQLYILVNDTILGEPAAPSPYLAEIGLNVED